MARKPKAAPGAWLGQLSDASLRDMAGDKTFARGADYWRSGRVELVRDDASAAQFEAHGTHTYDVSLRADMHAGELQADCDCPHADDGNFCKHMVAAALLWRQHLGGDEGPAAVIDPVKQARMAKAAQTRAANAQAVQRFLQAQPAAALADRLWQRAQADRDLMAELKAWAASAQADNDPKALRAAVDALLKISTRQFLERAEVRAWAGRAMQAMALLRGALPGLAADVRGIVDSVMQRLDGIEERTYDEAGEVDNVRCGFVDVLIDALHAAPPPAAWAEHLLQRMAGPGGHVWQDPRLLQAAGPDVARAYTRRLAERWERAAAGRTVESKAKRDALRRWMIDDLQRQGDTLAQFDFMKRSAVDAVQHTALVRWCRDNGRPRDALQLAQAAHKQFGNDWRVEDELLSLYAQDGWDAEALAIHQRRFAERPVLDNYRPLIQAARAAGADMAAVRAEAYMRVEVLELQDLAQLQTAAARYGTLGNKAKALGPNVSRRIAMLLDDGAIDEAVALVQPPHSCNPPVLEALADKLPKSDKARNEQALALLKRCFDVVMPPASTPYADPLRLLAKIVSRMGAAQARAYQLQVSQTWRARRNFIAGLPQLDG